MLGTEKKVNGKRIKKHFVNKLKSKHEEAKPVPEFKAAKNSVRMIF